MLRSMNALLSIDPGYELERVLVGNVSLSKMASFQLHSMSSYDQLLERLRAIPGVESVSSANAEMMTGVDPRAVAVIPGYIVGPGEDMHVGFESVGPDYFATLGIPLSTGRGFGPEDGPGTPNRAVVNRAMAHRFWPGSNPIGRQIEFNGTRFDVIGVSENVAFDDVRNLHVPRFYMAIRQFSAGGRSYAPMQQTLYVRVAREPNRMSVELRDALLDAAPALPPIEIRSLSPDRASTLRPTTLITGYLAFLGTLAMVLASVGLYGVVAYATAQRTKEFGVRIALGATRLTIITLVLREASRLLAIGLVLGVIGTMAARDMISAFVYSVGTADPMSYAGAVILLLTVAILASVLPALRAACVNPTQALRAE
jgi:predicted permease